MEAFGRDFYENGILPTGGGAVMEREKPIDLEALIRDVASRQPELRVVMVNDRAVVIPKRATGREIKWAAMRQGVHVTLRDQLQGRNCNGSNAVIGDNEVPWQHGYDTISIYDNA